MPNFTRDLFLYIFVGERLIVNKHLDKHSTNVQSRIVVSAVEMGRLTIIDGVN